MYTNSRRKHARTAIIDTTSSIMEPRRGRAVRRSGERGDAEGERGDGSTPARSARRITPARFRIVAPNVVKSSYSIIAPSRRSSAALSEFATPPDAMSSARCSASRISCRVSPSTRSRMTSRTREKSVR